MSPWATTILVTLAVLIIFAAVVLPAVMRRRLTTVETKTVGDTVLIWTPRGRGSARPVLHEDMGRVYEIDLRMRGEKHAVTYVPPAEHLVRAHVTERLEALSVRRNR